MDNYTQEVRVQKVEDTSIGSGERFKKRMAEIMIVTFAGVIILSFGIPLIFLDWFYKWKIYKVYTLIKIIIYSKYSGKFQYINPKYINIPNHQNTVDITSSSMLALYFYIVSFVLLLIIGFLIGKKYIACQKERILDREAKYEKEIERRKNISNPSL